MTRHFLDINDFDKPTLRLILEEAKRLKAEQKSGKLPPYFEGKTLAMLFEKSSTRTRFSFEVGMKEMGGYTVVTNSENSQLGRGETVEDTAKVLSRYVHMVMIRCYEHQTLLSLAESGSVPVINGLTDYSHPCQIMTDILTYEEHVGPIEDAVIAWVGDGNNMTTSWIHAANVLGFELRLACPNAFAPKEPLGNNVTLYKTAKEAVTNASCVTTDTWVSMGDSDAEKRHKLLAPYQVNTDLMGLAKPEAIFMHCLPAHREEEVTTAVIDGPQSVVFDEAENRLHAQKAIMAYCMELI